MDFKTYRERHGLTQAQLGELLTSKGIRATQSHVSQWERGLAGGGYDLPPKKAQAIAAAVPELTLSGLRPDLWPNDTHGRRQRKAA